MPLLLKLAPDLPCSSNLERKMDTATTLDQQSESSAAKTNSTLCILGIDPGSAHPSERV